MAIRPLRWNRYAAVVAAATLATTMAVSVAVIPSAQASPRTAPHVTPPTPSAASVQQKLQDLAKQNDQAVELYNQAQVLVQKTQRAAAAAERKSAAAQRSYTASLRALTATIAAQYEGGAFSTAGALLSSKSGQNYLDALNTLTMVNSHNSQVVQTMDAAKRSADAAKKAAAKAAAAAVAQRKSAADQKASVQKQISKYTLLLATLTATQKAAYVSKAAPAPTIAITNIPVPAGAAGQAVKFALAQVGKPYVWGAAGPGAFDCSGLTMASWAAGGVSLPHSSRDQYNYGTHVSISALQPGDLVFMYSPISHVTIYVGNGMLVSAVEPGVGVKLVTLASQMSIVVGATHLG